MITKEEAAELKAENRILRQDIYLQGVELSGVREQLEGLLVTVSGAQKAYRAVAQRIDLSEQMMNLKTVANGHG